MKKILHQFDLENQVLTVGLCLITAGVTSLSRPAGLIFMGLVCVAAALVISRKPAPEQKAEKR